MQPKKKKTIVIIGIVSIAFLAFSSIDGNKFVVTPDIALDVGTDFNFDALKTSNATSSEIIESMFDSKSANFSSNGYYPQVYSDSLQATYYALSVLDSIGKLNEINQGEVIAHIMSQYNSGTHQFVDSNAKRYLSSTIPGLYMPLTTLLEVNCYAVLSLDILSSLHLINTAETIDFIWECYHPTLHGFIGQPYDVSLEEGFKIPTADNTYYAVITLDLLMPDWNSYYQERSDIVDYVDGLQSIGSHTGFYNDNDPFFDSLLEIEPNQFASFYAIKTLETFGSSYVEIIDTARFHLDLTDLYHTEGFYFDISSISWVVNSTNIVATAINLELSDITGFTGFDRAKVIDFIIDNRNALGGWDASTTVKSHELIDIFQIIRSLANTGAISELTLSTKNEIASYIQLFSQFNGYSLLSEDYTSVELINTIISSYDYFDRIADLDLQKLYDLLEGSALYMGGDYDFYACTKLEPNVPDLRSRPFDYYTLGFHEQVDEINAMYSHKETYSILNSLRKIYKLDDFSISHDLNSILQSVIDSQFLDPDYQESYGAFLHNNIFSSSEWKNQLIYLKYSFYAIKVMELISDYLELGPITDLGFNETHLATYISRNTEESSTELYFDLKYSDNVEDRLENTYYAVYSLKAIDKYYLDSPKIENFVFNHLDYSNFKNLYYSYKISEILNFTVIFDVERSHSLIQSIYSSAYQEFFESTDRNRIEQEAFAWVCEMAKNDRARIKAQYSNSIQLGGNNSISVELCNLILSDFEQSATIKLESEQLGTILFENMTDHAYLKEVYVPIDSQNYPLIEGELFAYEEDVIIDQFPISFKTTYDSIYNFSTIKTESQIEITANASLRFVSGEQPVYDGIMRAEVYRNGTYLDILFFASEDGLKSTNFTFLYQPVYPGNYSFEIYVQDPFNSSSQFVFETTYDYFNVTGENSPSDDDPDYDPIHTFENDANITVPLAMTILVLGSGGFTISSKKTGKKVKRKSNKSKLKKTQN